jgi:hypothetical protein
MHPLSLMQELFKARGSKVTCIELNSMHLGALFLVALTGNLSKTVIYDHNHSRHFCHYSVLRRQVLRRLFQKAKRVRLVGEHLRDNYSKFGVYLPSNGSVSFPAATSQFGERYHGRISRKTAAICREKAAVAPNSSLAIYDECKE